MSSTMNKRVECPGPKESFQVVSKPLPQPPPYGLVVKNHYSGICHSDKHFWDLTMSQVVPGFQYPAVYGHEMAGEVYSVGTQYKGELVVGDQVVVHPWCSCGECGPCKAGDPLICKKVSDNNVGVGKEGGFQHFTPIEQGRHVLKVPKSIPLEVAAMLACSGITSFNAVNKLIPAAERAIRNHGVANVMVIGAGGLGLWGIQWAKALLPPQTKVFVADITQEKIQGGLDHGADEGIVWDRTVSDEELVQLTKEKTGGGVDGSVDFVGIGPTCGKAAASANKGGVVVVVGLGGGTMTVPIFPFVVDALRVEGTIVGDLTDMKHVMESYVQHNVKATPVTFVKPEDTERCLEELRAATFQGRYVIDWTKE